MHNSTYVGLEGRGEENPLSTVIHTRKPEEGEDVLLSGELLRWQKLYREKRVRPWDAWGGCQNVANSGQLSNEVGVVEEEAQTQQPAEPLLDVAANPTFPYVRLASSFFDI